MSANLSSAIEQGLEERFVAAELGHDDTVDGLNGRRSRAKRCRSAAASAATAESSAPTGRAAAQRLLGLRHGSVGLSQGRLRLS